MSMQVLRAIAFAIVLASCSPSVTASPSTVTPPSATPSPSATHYPLTVTDDHGQSLTLAQTPLRIISLVPAATEILFAIGAADRLIAVDDFSDFPLAAKDIPHIGGFRTSPETVIARAPDLVLIGTSGTLGQALLGLHQTVFILDPSDLEGVYQNIRTIGAMVEREAAAADLVASMQRRIDAVAAKARSASRLVRVLHEVDSTNPAQIFVAGPHNFIDSMITTAGGINVAADAAVKFPKLSPEEIVRRDPEVIVLADARFGATPEAVAARPGWGVIAAVRRHALYPIDDNIVSRGGPRLAEAFEVFLHLIHPELP
jgi:cobalamin transport system substrate-binding protein